MYGAARAGPLLKAKLKKDVLKYKYRSYTLTKSTDYDDHTYIPTLWVLYLLYFVADIFILLEKVKFQI